MHYFSMNVEKSHMTVDNFIDRYIRVRNRHERDLFIVVNYRHEGRHMYSRERIMEYSRGMKITFH